VLQLVARRNAVPIVHFWWRTLHQPAALLAPGLAAMPPSIRLVLAANWVALTLVFKWPTWFVMRR
jgi:hypothetical protein